MARLDAVVISHGHGVHPRGPYTTEHDFAAIVDRFWNRFDRARLEAVMSLP